MKIDYAGQEVIVTGGTGALGTAVVGLLLDAGARCSVPSRSRDASKNFTLATEAGVRLFNGVDLTDESQVEAFYADAAGGNRLWASIHVAGGFAMGPIEKTSADAFLHQISTNAVTCFLCCREAVRRMGDSGGGRIVNVCARPVLEPRTGAGMAAYTASKAAVAALTVALAQEVVARDILVNAVVPSIMDTPANRKAMPDADVSQWVDVKQVAATIAFLASPQNTSTRGGLVPVYGKA